MARRRQIKNNLIHIFNTLSSLFLDFKSWQHYQLARTTTTTTTTQILQLQLRSIFKQCAPGLRAVPIAKQMKNKRKHTQTAENAEFIIYLHTHNYIHIYST